MKRIKLTKTLQRCFLLTIFFLASVIQNVQAQSKNVKGNVKDASGEVLPGASIIVVGTSVGTMSDFDGNYEVRVSADAKSLSVSSLGYKTQEIAYSGQEVINIVLEEESNKLEEVVVVGYGTQKAKDVTGAISKIKEADIAKTANVTVEQALTGRIAGVNTVTSDGSLGAGMRIRIRGGTSVNANNEPLYVIDGIPMEVDYNLFQAPGQIETPPTSPLANIDPGSIVSIEVLKDASAAAIYGSRGANGVVMITTKTGKAGKARIFYDTSTSLSVVPKSRHIPMMDTYQYQNNLINTVLYRDGVLNANFGDAANVSKTPEEALAIANALKESFRGAETTDWQDRFFQMGVIRNHSLNASGGTEGNTYSVRAAYLNNEGTVRNSYFDRYNLTLNLQNKLTDKLKMKTSLMPSYSEKQGPTSGGGFSQRAMGSIIRTLSRQPDRGLGIIEDENEDTNVWVDPITEALKTKTLNTTFALNGNTSLIYQITKNFTANIKLGGNYSNGVVKNYFSKEFGRGFQRGGVGTRYRYERSSLNNQNMFTYKKAFGYNNKHRFTGLFGFTQTYNTVASEYMETADFDIETAGYEGLHYGQNPNRPVVDMKKKVMKSYIGRVNYNLGDTYNFTVSMRADGSSVFVKNQWGYFPAAAFGWNIHKETFMENANAISNMKLRMSYGQTGNAGVPFYASTSVYQDAFYVFGTSPTAVTGVANSNIADRDLRWEFTDQFDVGYELGLFDDRVNLTTDVYYKRTKDLLLNQPINPSTGFSQYSTNIGNVENKGLEVALNTINIDKDFKWTSDFTFAMNRNKVLSLGPINSDGSHPEQLFPDQFTNGEFTGLLRVDESLGNWLGFETDGVFNYNDFDYDEATGLYTYKDELKDVYGQFNDDAPKPGDLRYVDQNRDGIIDGRDRTIIARTQPKHYGSLYNSFSYKGLELGIFLTYKYGFDVINGNKHRINGTGGANWNKTADRVDAWTPENPNGSQPRPDYVNDKNFTDRVVEDGSFIRLQSINLGYTLPWKITKKLGLKTLKLYSNIDNIHIWTKYTGYDPEVSIARGQRAMTSANLDYGAYPRTLNVSLGLKIGL